MINDFPHESMIKHVNGESVFVDDILTNEQLLTGYVVYSPYAHAKIKSVNIDSARSMSGVYSILTAADIPGKNQMGPVFKDEVCLVNDKTSFIGQAVCLIAAESEEICRSAAKEVIIKYQPLPNILTIEEAIKKKQQLGETHKITRGNSSAALKDSPNLITGFFESGAQEHWYLETQVTLCVPGEEKEIYVYSSTQHPSETQALIADVLGIYRNDVIVEVRRMGGAFGGKETQANHTACWAALLCQATGRPIKIRLCRDDDQKMTGKRHPYLNKYKVGFDNSGRILAAEIGLNSNAGAAMDLSHAIMERAIFHIDNAYYIPDLSATGKMWRTNLPPNTALRGFGAPQAMATIENIIDRIARMLNMDPAAIRKKNFYGVGNRNSTPYGQQVERNHLHKIFKQIIDSSDYYRRRKNAEEFNLKNEFFKKGLALSPVKFGISFTTSFLNQAGVLVHIYQDGTILVNHGGTEMGQGLHTKIQQIAASELGISKRFIKTSATDTSKVPNTSATAASSGTDLNGMAVKNAIEKLKKRLADVAINILGYKSSYASQIIISENFVYHKKHPRERISFQEVVKSAYLSRVSLSATGFYRTPDINWDKKFGKGKPFNYFAFGMAVSEVELDILTGHHKILRTDILHDVGNSINRGIDLGQIQGGFIQGLGWCTTEECKWDKGGNLLNHSPDTYKIPTIGDIPIDFRVSLLENEPNPKAIKKSKAVGEPPLMLALSVWLAIKDAISAVMNHTVEPDLPIPATNEAILICINKLCRSKI